MRTSGAIEGNTDQLREAVDVLERSEARVEYARALIDLGAALRRAARRSEARDPLAKGLDLADRCDATLLATRAREELLAAGARPRRHRISGINSLTASERRIAEMAAQGHTSRQIAQALFVTTRTVDTHLNHTYTKLGINSRKQLPHALAREV